MDKAAFEVGDRVEHSGGGVGTVTEITPDGAVRVVFADGPGKGWKGEYDDFWFSLHPNGLKKVSA